MSDVDIESIKVFTRVAELRSFTEAARQLGMSKARASAQVQRLEADLGTQLLHRSTRVVRPTPEGELLLRRSPAFLAEADEIAAMFQAGRALRGRVRVELPVLVARDAVIPRLHELLERHPQLHLEICASDRIVAAQREGFDIVLRIGPVKEDGLIGRRLGEAPTMNAASPGYLRQHGTPRTLDDLSHGHSVVHFAADATATFEYFDGVAYRELPMPSVLTVDNIDTYEAAGAAGLGIIQVPRPAVPRANLVEILPTLVARPSPISLLHTHGRSAPRRVRAVMTWLAEVIAPMVREHTQQPARHSTQATSLR